MNEIGSELTPIAENEKELLTIIQRMLSEKIQKEDDMSSTELFHVIHMLSPKDAKKIKNHCSNYRRSDRTSRAVGDIYAEIIRRLFIQNLWEFDKEEQGEERTVRRARLTKTHARFHREYREMEKKLEDIESGKGYILEKDADEEIHEMRKQHKVELREQERSKDKEIQRLKYQVEKAQSHARIAETQMEFWKKKEQATSTQDTERYQKLALEMRNSDKASASAVKQEANTHPPLE